MRAAHGPPLPMGRQLRWLEQHKELHALPLVRAQPCHLTPGTLQRSHPSRSYATTSILLFLAGAVPLVWRVVKGEAFNPLCVLLLLILMVVVLGRRKKSA